MPIDLSRDLIAHDSYYFNGADGSTSGQTSNVTLPLGGAQGGVELVFKSTLPTTASGSLVITQDDDPAGAFSETLTTLTIPNGATEAHYTVPQNVKNYGRVVLTAATTGKISVYQHQIAH
jgi:hypothetical protein